MVIMYPLITKSARVMIDWQQCDYCAGVAGYGDDCNCRESAKAVEKWKRDGMRRGLPMTTALRAENFYGRWEIK